MRQFAGLRRRVWLLPTVCAMVITLGIPLWFAAYGTQQESPADLPLAAPGPADAPLAGSAKPLSSQQFKTVSDTLATMLSEQGSDETFAYITRQLAADPSFAHDCHPLMHMLGHAAVAYYGSFAETMRHQNEVCNSGFIHGAIEMTLAQAPAIAEAIKTTCPAGPGVGEDFGQWECYHGVGHGVMAAKGRQVNPSLGLCEQLASSFAVHACANGVFMEHFIVVDHTGVRRASKDIDVSFTACRQTSTAYKSDCYYYAPSAYLGLYPGQYTAAYRWCQAMDERYVPACVNGVGGQAMKDNTAHPDVARMACRAFTGSDRLTCVRGAISMYLNNRGSIAATEHLCTNEFRDFRTVCEAVVASRRGQFET